jgi:hypothetical protein
MNLLDIPAITFYGPIILIFVLSCVALAGLIVGIIFLIKHSKKKKEEEAPK